MKIFYYAPDGGLNSTDTKSALAVWLTLGIFLFIGVTAVVDATLQVIPGGSTGITIKEIWLEMLIVLLSFVAVLHGISWGSGWSKRNTETKVAQAEAIRTATNGHVATKTSPTTGVPQDAGESGEDSPRGRPK